MIVLAISTALLAASGISYLLYHSLVEFFTITVALLLGVVSWYTYPLARNGMLAFLGIFYPAIAAIDLAHTLAYQGMNVLPTQGADAATQLWLLARYVQAFVMVAAPAFIGSRVPRRTLATAATLLAGALIGLVAWNLFPTAYEDGVGLTPFKIASEYVIILLFLVALAHLLRRRALIDPLTLRLLIGALLCSVAAEFAFTQYAGTYDIANLIGHVCKLMGFWLIFVAVVKIGLEKPFRLMTDKISTYDAIPRPVIVVDREGRIHQLNQAARRAAPSVAVGADHHAVFHPSNLSRSECPACLAVTAGKRTDDLELHYPDSNRWCIISIAPLALAGKTQAMVQEIHDITARKEAEIAERAAEERIRLLLDSVGEGICGVDREGRTTFVNAAAARMLGYQLHEIIGRPLHDLINREGTITSGCAMRRLLVEGLPSGWEHGIFWRKDGTRLPVAHTAMPIVEHGTTVGAVVSFMDITGRLAAEEALRDSEERFRSISAAAQDAIVMIDGEGRIAYWNPAAERMLGYGAEEALGRDAHALLAPARFHSAYKQGFATFSKQGTGPAIGKVLELAAMRKDGMEFPIELSVSSLQLSGQWHAVGIIRDITARKAAEAEHQQLLAIIEATPDFIATFEPQGDVTYLNAAARKFLAGDASGALPIKHIEDAYPSWVAKLVREEAIPTAMQNGVWQGELVLRGDGNAPIPVSQVILTHHDPESGAPHLSTVARDISDRKRLEGALRAAAAREEHIANAVINSLPGFYILMDERERLHRWNSTLERVTGFDAEQIAAMDPLTLFRNEDRAPVREATKRVFEHGYAEIQASLVTSSGAEIPCFMTGTRIELDGRPYLNGTALDISALKEAEIALAQSRARLRHALQCAHAGTWDVNLGTRKVHWSRETFDLHGMEPGAQEISMESWLERVNESDRAKIQESLGLALSSGHPDYTVDYRIHHAAKGERWIGQFGRIQYDRNGSAVSISGLDLDITERKRAEELLQQLAKHDHLTGIYNRLYVSEWFDMQLKRADRYRRPCAVVLFDIDHFKRVNDTYGHSQGDEVLKSIAETVKTCLRNADIFVRWGGEEFLVIAPETALEGAFRLAEKMRAAIAAMRFLNMGNMTASFGVAEYRVGEPTDTLIKRADDALYAAKTNGRNQVQMSSPT